MPKFSQKSLYHLADVDERLVKVLMKAIELVDFTVLDGIRTRQEQVANIARGVSWTMASKHLPNKTTGKSDAVDIAPYPLYWEDTEAFCVLAGYVKACAVLLGVKIRWGGDWDSDGRLIGDERKRDYGHFELVGT